MGEVAGPDCGLAGTGLEVRPDRDLRLLEAAEGLILVEGDGKAVTANGHTHDVDVDVALVKLDAALAKSHRDAAPVAVVTIAGGLHERRVGDGASAGVRVLVGSGSGDRNGHELRSTLAIGRDLAREVLANGIHGNRELGGLRRTRLDGSDVLGGFTRGKRDAGVIG